MPFDLPVAPFAIGLALIVLVGLLQRLPVIGGVIRLAVTVGLVGVALLLFTERAPLDPMLAGIADRFQLDRQRVAGDEVRIAMAPNGHFMADARLNGVKRRMLIDSGATVTAVSEQTAARAGLKPDVGGLPVVIQTANGTVPARTATLPELRIGNIVARDIKVVVSPAFGPVDVIGMNLLSKLKSWRVEGRTLILQPHHPQAVTA